MCIPFDKVWQWNKGLRTISRGYGVSNRSNNWLDRWLDLSNCHTIRLCNWQQKFLLSNSIPSNTDVCTRNYKRTQEQWRPSLFSLLSRQRLRRSRARTNTKLVNTRHCFPVGTNSHTTFSLERQKQNYVRKKSRWSEKRICALKQKDNWTFEVKKTICDLHRLVTCNNLWRASKLYNKSRHVSWS